MALDKRAGQSTLEVDGEGVGQVIPVEWEN